MDASRRTEQFAEPLTSVILSPTKRQFLVSSTGDWHSRTCVRRNLRLLDALYAVRSQFGWFQWYHIIQSCEMRSGVARGPASSSSALVLASVMVRYWCDVLTLWVGGKVDAVLVSGLSSDTRLHVRTRCPQFHRSRWRPRGPADRGGGCAIV